MDPVYVLRLYIAGRSPASLRALSRLRELCAADLAGRYRLEVVDVIEEPDRAERDRVLATPTLVKELPPPTRRVVGDLSDRDEVLLGLDLAPITRDADPSGAERG